MYNEEIYEQQLDCELVNKVIAIFSRAQIIILFCVKDKNCQVGKNIAETLGIIVKKLQEHKQACEIDLFYTAQILKECTEISERNKCLPMVCSNILNLLLWLLEDIGRIEAVNEKLKHVEISICKSEL